MVEELHFAAGVVEAVVLPEVGARLHRLRAFGHDLLRTPAEPEVHLRDPFFWGAYPMAPWCNRIESEPIVVGSRRIDLQSNFPDGSAIHGQVYARPWEPLNDGTLHIRAGGDGWPWDYEVVQRIEVDERSLRLDLALRNRSDGPMPAGLGIHPWFRRPVHVAIRGDAVHPSNTDTRPEPEPVPVQGPFDLRRLGEMSADLDATWTQLATPPVELLWDTLGIRVTMRVAAPAIYVVAASPGRLDAIAVEPETHAPQGLRRMLNDEPGGMAMLAAGQALDLSAELIFERVEPSRA